MLSRPGLRAEDIRTDVELKLRLAGITVLPPDNAGPFLYINVSALKGKGPLSSEIAFSDSVALNQAVKLDRNGTLTIATTWSVGQVGITGVDNIRNVRNFVKDDVDKFVNDWLEARGAFSF